MYFVELLCYSGKHLEWYIILYIMLKECDVFKQRALIILKIFGIFEIHKVKFM